LEILELEEIYGIKLNLGMVLIIEPISSGHHVSLYLKSIIKELLNKNIDFEIMTTTESFDSEVFKNLQLNDNIEVHKFKKPYLFKKLNLFNQFLWYFAIKTKYKKVCKDRPYKIIYFNSLDLINNAIIFLGSPFNNTNYSGLILKMGWIRNNNKISTHYLKKKLIKLYKIWFNKNNVKKIFFIDRYYIDYFNSIKNKHKLIYLNDAVDLEYNSEQSSVEIRDKINILVYGSISKRKGLKFLETSLLNSNLKKRLKLVIAGKVHKDYLNEFDEIINNFKRENWNIEVMNKWVTKEEEFKLFSNTDIVWSCYEKSFSGSSGVIYIAGAFKKPVIVNNTGYISEIVLENNNGEIVNSNDFNSITASINKLLNNSKQREKLGKNGYVLSKKHDSKLFAKNIVNEFLHEL
jgi:glycosyltransferase involved in cell wall biosynthesis